MGYQVSGDKIALLTGNVVEKTWHPFPNILVVAWELPNGFVLVDSGSCIDPENYDEEIGLKIARDNLKSHLGKLEGYLMKSTHSEH